jgi:DNA-3-methyladenine glycosylase II
MSFTHTTDDFQALAGRDPAFGRALQRWGQPEPLSGEPLDVDGRFAALARAIINQQLSVRAAATIYERVVTAAGGELTPGRILGTPGQTLREAGMSGAKVRALEGLGHAVADGELDLMALDDVSDDDAFGELVAIRGIGPWTAEVFLMFALNRSDVMAAADVGVRGGIQAIFDLDARPTAKELAEMAEAWRPYRTAACRLAWHAVSATPIADLFPES